MFCSYFGTVLFGVPLLLFLRQHRATAIPSHIIAGSIAGLMTYAMFAEILPTLAAWRDNRVVLDLQQLWLMCTDMFEFPAEPLWFAASGTISGLLVWATNRIPN
jgi:hypothetical protein